MSVRKTRNDTDFYYCLMDTTTQYEIVDENGNDTGEIVPSYDTAVAYYANVSPATGQNQAEIFGNLDNYDKVLVTTDMDCPIDENTVLFLEKDPEYSTVSAYQIVEGESESEDDEVETVSYSLPKYDYFVRRVAKSLNSISIAVRKAEVG